MNFINIFQESQLHLIKKRNKIETFIIITHFKQTKVQLTKQKIKVKENL